MLKRTEGSKMCWIDQSTMPPTVPVKKFWNIYLINVFKSVIIHIYQWSLRIFLVNVCEQILSFLRICSHFLKKSLVNRNFMFCAVEISNEHCSFLVQWIWLYWFCGNLELLYFLRKSIPVCLHKLFWVVMYCTFDRTRW